jgi:hypothetical protein
VFEETFEKYLKKGIERCPERWSKKRFGRDLEKPREYSIESRLH